MEGWFPKLQFTLQAPLILLSMKSTKRFESRWQLLMTNSKRENNQKLLQIVETMRFGSWNAQILTRRIFLRRTRPSTAYCNGYSIWLLLPFNSIIHITVLVTRKNSPLWAEYRKYGKHDMTDAAVFLHMALFNCGTSYHSYYREESLLLQCHVISVWSAWVSMLQTKG